MTPPTEPFDLVVASAALRGVDGLRSVGVRDGVIATVVDEQLPGLTVLDANGALVTPSFVNAHMHLDKVYTLDALGDATRGRLHRRRRWAGPWSQSSWRRRSRTAMTKKTIEANARRCLLAGLRHGLRHVLAFADVDTHAELRGITPLLRLREEFHGVIDLQVVAFPQDGLLRDPGAEELVNEAVSLGADVVGRHSVDRIQRRRRTTSTCGACASSPPRGDDGGDARR